MMMSIFLPFTFNNDTFVYKVDCIKKRKFYTYIHITKVSIIALIDMVKINILI